MIQNSPDSKEAAPSPNIPLPPSRENETLVSVMANSTTKSEMLELVLQWISAQGYTKTAQTLRGEATAQHKNDSSARKHLGALIRNIEERNWDNASKALQRLHQFLYAEDAVSNVIPALRGPLDQLVNTLPFLIAQQQFLELVGNDSDGYKAYSFFMKYIKPLESTVERNQFKRLNYLLTCKSVEEASHLFPEYSKWSPSLGCAQLISFINRVIVSTPLSSLGSTTISELGPSTSEMKPLERYIEQALSYQLLAAKYPKSIPFNIPTVPISSISAPFTQQLPPIQPIAAVDIASLFPRQDPRKRKHIALTCSLLLPTAHAIAVGISTGDILSISSDFLREEIKQLIIPQKYFQVWKLDSAVRGIQGGRKQGNVLCWGDYKACLIRTCTFDDSYPQECASDCTLKIFDFDEPITCACLLPGEKVIGTGYSDGSIAVWDVAAGSQIYRVALESDSSIVTLISNRLGTVLYAAVEEGVIESVDSVTGIYLSSFVPPIPMEITSLTLSPSSSFLLASYRGGTLRLWDTVSGKEVLPHFVNSESTGRKASVSFGATDQHIFCGQEDGTVLFWDTSIYSRLAEIPQDSSLSAIQGRYLALTHHYPTLRLRLHHSSVNDVTTSEGNFLLSCGSDGILSVCSTLQPIK